MRGRKAQARLRVTVEQVRCNDAPERLGRAFDILLRAAARAGEAATQEGAPIQNAEQEANNAG